MAAGALEIHSAGDRRHSAMNLGLLIPEFAALAVLFVLMFGELFIKDFSQKLSAKTALAGALIVIGTLIARFGSHGFAFGEMYRADAFSYTFKLFFTAALIPVIQMSREFFASKLKHPGEFILILWSCLIGMFFLASSNDLLLLFIGLEIITMSFYIMAAFLKKELFSIEAGLKYLIFGSLASAFLIYGISFVYAAAGTTSFSGVKSAFAGSPDNIFMLLGLLFMISGVGFKVASVPFHLWVPDVYEGAPSPVVAFLSTGSKAAGFVVALKLLFLVFLPFEGRADLFAVLSAMTLVYGNLGALVQTNIKRLFGYSSISHAGYLMMGLASGGISGAASIIFYLMVYSLSNLAAFMVISVTGRELESDNIKSYRGLVSRSPLLAAVMFIALLSLAGIPPLAGFFGKLLLLLGAVQNGLLWLAILGAVLVAVSLYYYLSVVKVMYVDEAITPSQIPLSLCSRVILVVLAAGIIVMGIWQAPLYYLAENAAAALF